MRSESQAATGHGPRAVRNAGFSASGLVVGTAVLFLTTPILLRSLGAAEYGIFSLALAVSGVFSILNLGVGPAVTYELSKTGHSRSAFRAGQVTATAMALTASVSVFGLLVIVALAPRLVVLLGVEPSLRLSAVGALRAAGLLLSARLMGSVLHAVFTAYQRFGPLTVFTVGIPTLSTICALVVAVRGGDAAAAAFGAFVGSAVVVGIECAVAKRMFVRIALMPRLARDVLPDLWNFGHVAFLTQICGIILVQADKFIVGRAAGMEALGDYSVVFSVAFRIQIVLAAIAAVVFPMASEFLGKADRNRNLELYSQAVRLCSVVGVLLLVPMLVLSRVFLSLWISPAFAARLDGVFTVLALSSFTLGAAIVPHHVLNGLGMPRVNLVIATVVVALSIGLNIALVPFFGLNGSAAAALIAAAPNIYLFRRAEAAVGANGTAASIFVKLFLVGGVALLFGIWVVRTLPVTWLALVAESVLLCLLVLGLAWLAGIVGRQDALILRRALAGAGQVP